MSLVINLQSPRVLYIGQAYRYSPEQAFYVFSQQIYCIIFLDFLSPSSFIPPQNVVYFLMLPFLVHKIFTFYINGLLNCKCPAPGPKSKVLFHFFYAQHISDINTSIIRSLRLFYCITTLVVCSCFDVCQRLQPATRIPHRNKNTLPMW